MYTSVILPVSRIPYKRISYRYYLAYTRKLHLSDEHWHARIKQIQNLINVYIAEKQKRLPCYQATFNTAYELIKNDVRGLPFTCQRKEFTNQYIQNYDFSYYSQSLKNDDTSFLHEILQFHYNALSDIILQDLWISIFINYDRC